ncbi:hypothetical protein PX554_22300 [Sphingomonas sp. H39-1-10]|uniref:hypothetical protein n=1 Tax=Sphingomonas TaxID=13687 RepID=UPI00088C2F4F|nr:MULTISPECIES: hypothetical protein [Sphingomonas]MDF0490866.1 hypothetical protein [Sphingomonas pollutisoli]SDA21944.1 hypothetical protein SAMN03159340_01521 [Sphingomonas sp. NFR15]
MRCNRLIAIIALALATVGCGARTAQRSELDSLDNQLADSGSGNGRDPAMMAALHDQIMVDPALAQQANDNAVRPPSQPYSGAIPADTVAAAANGASGRGADTSETLKSAPAPKADGSCPQCEAARQSLTLGALASRQKDKRTASCAGGMRYSARWATRLPPDLPLYPDARVSEAAGASDNGCALRAVSFATAAPLQRVIDWYYTRASGAGFAAEHEVDGGQHVLGGTRGRDGAAFALFLTARRDGGTEVDLVANNGS